MSHLEVPIAEEESSKLAENLLSLQVDQQNRVQFVIVQEAPQNQLPSDLSRDPLAITETTAPNEVTGEHSPEPEKSRKPSSSPPLRTVYEESGPEYSYNRCRSATLPHRPAFLSRAKSHVVHTGHSENTALERHMRFVSCRGAESYVSASTKTHRRGGATGAASGASSVKVMRKKYSGYLAPSLSDLHAFQRNLAGEGSPSALSTPELETHVEEENPQAELARQNPLLYAQTYELGTFVASQAGASSTSGPGLRPGQQAVGGVGGRKTWRVNGSCQSSLATSLLVPVSVLHLVTTLPMSVLALIEAANDMRSRIPSPGDRTFISIILYALMFSYMNHGINCYVYFVSSTRFRAHLWRLCRYIYSRLACCSCMGLRPLSIPSIGTSKRCSFDTKSSADTVLAENTAGHKQHSNTQLKTQ